MEEYNLKVWTPTQGERKVSKINFETGEVILDIPTVVNIKAKNFKLMRCSGLRDKNGELIYEGHKVKIEHKEYSFSNVKIGKVYFIEGYFFVKIKGCSIIDNREYNYTEMLYEINDRCEIIGNIYEGGGKEC